MSKNEKQTRVRVNSNHGTLRIVAGHWIGIQATDLSVDDAVLAELRADPCLNVESLDGVSGPEPRNLASHPTPRHIAEERNVNVIANPGGLEEGRPRRDMQREATERAEAERIAALKALPSQEERAKTYQSARPPPLPSEPPKPIKR